MVRPRICCNSAFINKNELDENALETLIKDTSATPIPKIILSYISILVPALIFAFVLGPPAMFNNKDLQKTTRLALKLFVKGYKYSQANSAL